MRKQNNLLAEMEFCLDLWEKQGGCSFGGRTHCKDCAALYLLWKMLTKEVLEGLPERLTFDEWKARILKYKSSM